MKKLFGKVLPVFPLALIPSMVYAQETSFDVGLKIFIASLPVIIGVILVVYLLQVSED